jgi:hypothetical protein
MEKVIRELPISSIDSLDVYYAANVMDEVFLI